ncbi:MAG: DUF86 domain-containing protein [Anaerolineales bacterium]|nr:DUF86 domain-containing protein [Anaerolineales bacterium]
MINGVILQKLQALDDVLIELRSLGAVSVSQLQAEWRTRRAIERDLQVLVEIVIDVCQRLLSVSGNTPSSTGRQAVERCINLGILSDAAAYKKMVQFRNFIVHRYERVDDAILVDMVNRRLTDFDRFREEVLLYASQQSSDTN